jgi:hypothetical protein
VISAYIIQVLDLVDSDDPVLTREGFLDGIEDGADIWKLNASDTILRLSCGEERVVVVVGHLVPIEILLVGLRMWAGDRKDIH